MLVLEGAGNGREMRRGGRLGENEHFTKFAMEM